jgi:ABC-2 type transport system ATP-binding protein
VTNLNDVSQKPRRIVTVTGGGEAPAGFEMLSEDHRRRVFRTDADGIALLRLLTALRPDSFTVGQESIEDRFMSLYRGGENK